MLVSGRVKSKLWNQSMKFVSKNAYLGTPKNRWFHRCTFSKGIVSKFYLLGELHLSCVFVVELGYGSSCFPKLELVLTEIPNVSVLGKRAWKGNSVLPIFGGSFIKRKITKKKLKKNGTPKQGCRLGPKNPSRQTLVKHQYLDPA